MSIRNHASIMLFLVATATVPAHAEIDMSRLVTVGDSLTAGFQNGSLHEAHQPNGFANVIARQADAALPLPLIAAPGIPNVLTLIDPGPPPVIAPEPGVSTGRVDPSEQVFNLAVPGARVEDALTSRPDAPIDSLTDLVLGLPGLFAGISRSQVEWAEALAPTTIIVWIGPNDALGAALEADPSFLTPIEDFEAAYNETIDRLAKTDAAIVIANIPDVTVIPFLTSAEEVAEAVGAPLDVIGPILGIAEEDFITPDASGLVAAILAGLSPGPLPDDVVLDADEVAEIRTATDAFNGVIADKAEDVGAAFVDIHTFLNFIDFAGIVVGGQRLTTEYLGGSFSLDGIHPTNTGHALIANEFIHAMNTEFGAGIPPVSVRKVQKRDPLVLPGVGHPPSALGPIGIEDVDTLRDLLVPMY
jgi:lysophospholipase L1-like esterase